MTFQEFINTFTATDATGGRVIKTTTLPSDGSDILTNSDSTGGRRIKVEVEGGSSSRLIASKLNVNLKDVAANILDWESGKTAANTAPTSVVVTMAENDTYVDNTTAFQLELNSVAISDAQGNSFQGAIATLTNSKIVSSTITPYVIDNTGDWALPVTIGTLNDFRVNIYIYGDTIE